MRVHLNSLENHSSLPRQRRGTTRLESGLCAPPLARRASGLKRIAQVNGTAIRTRVARVFDVAGAVLEAGELVAEEEVHRARGTITLLANNELGLAAQTLDVALVVLFAETEEDRCRRPARWSPIRASQIAADGGRRCAARWRG